MRSPPAASSFLTILFFWSNLIWVVNTSVYNAYPPRWRRQVQHTDTKIAPPLTAWYKLLAFHICTGKMLWLMSLQEQRDMAEISVYRHCQSKQLYTRMAAILLWWTIRYSAAESHTLVTYWQPLSDLGHQSNGYSERHVKS